MKTRCVRANKGPFSGKRECTDMIQAKRVYEMPDPGDGVRVLVDRIWPRGLSKNKARVDLWLKEIAPSAALRAWFAHDRAKWPEFVTRYREELGGNPDVLKSILELGATGAVTLLFAASDEACNNGVALMDYLQEHASAASQPKRR